MKRIIETKSAPAPIGPYSQAVLHNGTLFMSGQIAIDPTNGEYHPSDATTETKQVMKNIEAVLLEAGMSFSNVLKTSIFLKDMNDFAAVNEEYAKYFTADFPARETVQVSVLPKNARVEISMIAAL
ncbi:MAG: RidA family protein [Flavobacteriales bacterium]|jgi:2-iminobutanoate/2-iminopropanoate deaminase